MVSCGLMQMYGPLPCNQPVGWHPARVSTTEESAFQMCSAITLFLFLLLFSLSLYSSPCEKSFNEGAYTRSSAAFPFLNVRRQSPSPTYFYPSRDPSIQTTLAYFPRNFKGKDLGAPSLLHTTESAPYWRQPVEIKHEAPWLPCY